MQLELDYFTNSFRVHCRTLDGVQAYDVDAMNWKDAYNAVADAVPDAQQILVVMGGGKKDAPAASKSYTHTPSAA